MCRSEDCRSEDRKTKDQNIALAVVISPTGEAENDLRMYKAYMSTAHQQSLHMEMQARSTEAAFGPRWLQTISIPFINIKATCGPTANAQVHYDLWLLRLDSSVSYSRKNGSN